MIGNSMLNLQNSADLYKTGIRKKQVAFTGDGSKPDISNKVDKVEIEKEVAKLTEVEKKQVLQKMKNVGSLLSLAVSGIGYKMQLDNVGFDILNYVAYFMRDGVAGIHFLSEGLPGSTMHLAGEATKIVGIGSALYLQKDRFKNGCNTVTQVFEDDIAKVKTKANKTKTLMQKYHVPRRIGYSGITGFDLLLRESFILDMKKYPALNAGELLSTGMSKGLPEASHYLLSHLDHPTAAAGAAIMSYLAVAHGFELLPEKTRNKVCDTKPVKYMKGKAVKVANSVVKTPKKAKTGLVKTKNIIVDNSKKLPELAGKLVKKCPKK